MSHAASHRRPLLFLLFALTATIALALPARAHAFEKQWHAGASVGYAALIRTGAYHGFGGGLHLTYGINDTFNFMAELDATAHPSGERVMFGGGVGVGYVFDVLQWVPYVGALVGAADLASTALCGPGGVPCHDVRLNLMVPFGLDYQLSRSLSVGAAGRYQLMLGATSPVHVIGAFARVEYVWGY